MGIAETYTVPSESRKGWDYIVSRLDNGRWMCSCPDRRPEPCKHIMEIATKQLARMLGKYSSLNQSKGE